VKRSRGFGLFICSEDSKAETKESASITRPAMAAAQTASPPIIAFSHERLASQPSHAASFAELERTNDSRSVNPVVANKRRSSKRESIPDILEVSDMLRRSRCRWTNSQRRTLCLVPRNCLSRSGKLGLCLQQQAAGKKRGKQPLWLSTIMRYHIQPVVKRLGINKRVSWHLPAHRLDTSPCEWRRHEGGVVQELLRHGSAKSR
jgi:hypothetical protein